jgi:hypothetical protein
MALDDPAKAIFPNRKVYRDAFRGLFSVDNGAGVRAAVTDWIAAPDGGGGREPRSRRVRRIPIQTDAAPQMRHARRWDLSPRHCTSHMQAEDIALKLCAPGGALVRSENVTAASK